MAGAQIEAELVVVGGGIAGLAAAVSAREQGATSVQRGAVFGRIAGLDATRAGHNARAASDP
jgi:glycine/D-amino acid oxidase-like deaminating enzyme